ncbi:hypothetical protein WA026_022759 [Henosepilachna vigintioctopunctata]|uniref:Phorbol-ester/DAG-type domain-containing protein n=1 Tax=Henosepilachna vigintioctopunctata TaxID=420089 RepID=A0AAW1UQC0_9CUCU
MAYETDDAYETSCQKCNDFECINDLKSEKNFAYCAKKCSFLICSYCEKIFHRSCTKKLNNVKYINGNFVNCCQPQKCEENIISQKSDKHTETRTSEVLEKEILETKMHFLSKLLQSANEKNEIMKMNNALLIQKIEASEGIPIPRKQHKPDASVNDNLPKHGRVIPNEPIVETPVVEINSNVYSYRNFLKFL